MFKINNMNFYRGFSTEWGWQGEPYSAGAPGFVRRRNFDKFQHKFASAAGCLSGKRPIRWHTWGCPFITCTIGKGGMVVKDYIEERVLTVGEYLVEHRATVRQAAKQYGISKSTVHKDMTERIERISPALAAEVKHVLEFNKAERHIRGGRATKIKYKGAT